MDLLCIKCKGKGFCGGPCKILNKFKENAPKPKLHFSGKSAPEIFVGRIGYPNVQSGILTPSENDNISNFPTAVEWSKNNFSIENILRLRGQLIYGKSISNIKKPDRIKKLTQELALSSKPVSTEIFLKKKPTTSFTSDSVFSPMTNPAPIKKAILEENPFIHKKVDYLTSDNDAKATDALTELYSSKIPVDHLQKLLSVGLLGKSLNRKMVPTRWSITATDDIISKKLIDNIKYFKQIDEVNLLEGNYLGNYIYAILLPGNFSLEAIEFWRLEDEKIQIVNDYEGFNGRKTYASNVTGGYYSMRLPITEYLNKIKCQATVLVLREIKTEYYAPLGVGIVREATRKATNQKPLSFSSIEEAILEIQNKIGLNIPLGEISWILKNYGKQKTLKEFLSKN